jgi:hypothetical protein
MKEVQEADVIYAEKDEKVHAIAKADEKIGNGKAVFLGEGSSEDFLDQERKDKGLFGWYEKIKNL